MLHETNINGLVLIYVATYCFFQLECKEYAGLWVYIQNKIKKDMEKNRTKTMAFKMDIQYRDKEVSIVKDHWIKV